VNPIALAFLGDSVWSLYLRCHHLTPPKNLQLYQSSVRAWVSAEAQAAQFDALMSSGHLTPEEQELLAWVMSCEQVNFRKRFTSTQDMQTYRKATALEALVGYWHLKEPTRLQHMLSYIHGPEMQMVYVQRATEATDD